MAKYRRISVGETYLVRQNISWDLRNLADYIESQIVSKYRFDSILRRNQTSDILIKRGILEPNYKQQMEVLNQRLEDLKFQIYLERNNPPSVERLRKQIRRTEQTFEEISERSLSLDHCTLEFMAEQEAFVIIFRRLVRPKVKNYELLRKIASKFNADQIISKEIRKTARSEPWKSNWSTKKHGCFRILPLTNEQLTLVTYSQMYDGVNKHSEKPPDFVIKDDDMLDGWIISQTREDIVKKKTSSKNANAQELFVMADSQIQANEVYAKNSPDARFAQISRQRKLEREGAVKHHQFPDIQQMRMFQNAKR